jgi:hypothetical protein
VPRNRSLRAAVALALVVLAGGSSHTRPADQTVLEYMDTGTGAIIPIRTVNVVTIGVVVVNPDDRHVVVQSFEVTDQDGVRASAELVVGSNRESTLGSAVGFPPKPDGLWAASAVKPFGRGFRLPPGERGYNVLVRVERVARFGVVKGYRVRGTISGRPFIDEIDSNFVVCGDADTVTPECERYAAAYELS